MQLWQLDVMRSVRRLADGREAKLISGVDNHSHGQFRSALNVRL